MSSLTLNDLSDKMRKIDFAMLSTRTEGGQIAARPMSNNGEVEYKGDNFFFALGSTRTVADIARDPQVGLSFHGHSGLFGQKPFFIAVEGTATPIRDKARFAEHWSKDLDRWFAQGIDTPDLVLIQVHARRIHYWDGMEEGELVL